MLNYIWAGLIIVSVVFALSKDGKDILFDRYHNGDALAVQIEGLPPGYEEQTEARKVDVSIRIDPATYIDFFDPIGTMGYAPDSPEADEIREQIDVFFKEPLPGTLETVERGRELQITKPESLPAPLDVVYKMTKNDDEHLPSRVMSWEVSELSATAQISFGNVAFVKTRDITTTMFDNAKGAVTFSIGLMGAIALWMGLMKIAEDAGLINIFVKIVRPVLGPFFPQLPKDHPALGLIALNLAANMLGLGNAATPLGIKAMESLQELNPEKDTATDSMVMLLAMNTAGVQLLPPVTLMAILGVSAGDLFIPILMVTGLSLVIAVTTTKLLGRMKVFRDTDPMRNGPVTATTTEGGDA